MVADDLNTTIESDDVEKAEEEHESLTQAGSVPARSDPRYEVLLSTLQELFDTKGDAVSIDELQAQLNAQSTTDLSASRLLRRR